MKKLLLSALALTLTISMVACGSAEEPAEGTSNEAPVSTEAPAAPEATEAPAESGEADVEESTETPAEGEVVEGEVAEGTVGNTLLVAFNDMVANDAEADALTLAEGLVAHESVALIGPVTMEVEPGFLMGFENYEVTGFEQGVMFAPMIGSVPFVGYVFTLPADADVDAFVTGLKDNANLRWNICVEADEMVVEANGNKVFFVMCPATIEQ